MTESTGSEPTRRSRAPAFAVLAFVLAALAVITLRTASAVAYLRAPIPHALAALADMRNGRFDAALVRMSRPYQDGHDEARLRVAVASVPALANHTAVYIHRVAITESSLGMADAWVEGILELPVDAVVPVRILLTRNDLDSSDWHVFALEVDGQRLP